MSAALSLAWRLARAGGRFRTGAVVGGNAIGATLFLLVLSIPAAIRPPGSTVDDDEALLLTSIVVLLCLPVTMLLLSIGRLSASTRDRRLASLRMLGLSPARTRLVAGIENGLLAVAGVVVGLGAYLVAAPLVDAWVAAGPGWFRQPLHLPWPSVALTCGGLVLLSVVVSLAPTRSLQRGHMQVRREGTTARPSWWRVVPLVVGVTVLVVGIVRGDPEQARTVSEDQLATIVLTGIAVTGIGLAIALPLAVRGIADLVARRAGNVTVRLAAARLACEPAGTVRVVSGVAVAAFLGTCLVGLIAAVGSTTSYVEDRDAYEQGPQRHMAAATVSGGALTGAQLRRIEATPGVRGVIPRHQINATGCVPTDGFCGDVFVGTCEQLNLLWTVPGCRDTEVARVGSPDAAATEGIELENQDGRTATVVPTATLPDTPGRRLPDLRRLALFVPASSPQVSELVTEPTWYMVLSGPGQPPRDALRATASELSVNVDLEPLGAYRSGQRIQALLWTLTAIVVGIGLLSMLLTAVDRAIERRRQIASQRVVGVPLRVLRGSQLLQSLLPLWLALAGAIGLGFLPLAALVRMVVVSGPQPDPYLGGGPPLEAPLGAPAATLAMMGVAALAAAVVVAAATLPGIGSRLTPDLLRRE